jgi:hypothetical protein
MATQWAFMMPVTITDDNNHFDCSLGDVTIATGEYESMLTVVSAINTATGGTPTLAIGANGKVTASHGSAFTLDWSTGPNASDTIGGVLGFDTSADDTGASSYESDYQHTRAWYSERPPEYDSWDLPVIRGGKLHIAESKLTKRVTNPNTFYLRETDFALISQEKWHSDYAATNEAFEEWFDEAGRGEECVMITNTATMARAGVYVLVSPDGSLLASSSREGPDAPYFNVALRWHKVGA